MTLNPGAHDPVLGRPVTLNPGTHDPVLGRPMTLYWGTRDPEPGARYRRPEEEGPELALALPQAAGRGSPLQSARGGESSECHLPVADMVTKTEAHHMSLQCPSCPTSSKSLENTVLLREEERGVGALPGCVGPAPRGPCTPAARLCRALRCVQGCGTEDTRGDPATCRSAGGTVGQRPQSAGALPGRRRS